MNKSLNIAIEQTKLKIFQSFNQITNESQLPSYLLEGIILDILSEIRNRKNLELVSDINSISEEEKDKKSEE